MKGLYATFFVVALTIAITQGFVIEIDKEKLRKYFYHNFYLLTIKVFLDLIFGCLL
jgi:hypothetical protein